MPSLAFFGATGDCAGYCLAFSLKAGYDCTALARTPAKLTKSMKAKGVSADTLDQHLTIIEGNVKDISAVKRTLQLPNGQVVNKIVSGIGGPASALKFQWSLRKPVYMDDATICLDAGTTILRALQEIKPVRKPYLINVSTTGIQPAGKPRDVPLLFAWVYHWLGQDMHDDKMALQGKLAEHCRLAESERGIDAHTNVKASLLMDGEAKGLQAVRVGVEDKPAVGYTIRRMDVGLWMFERLVENDAKAEWLNNSVTVTY